MCKWRIKKEYGHRAAVMMESLNGEWEASIRFDGCIQLEGPNEFGGHICNFADFAALMADLVKEGGYFFADADWGEDLSPNFDTQQTDK